MSDTISKMPSFSQISCRKKVRQLQGLAFSLRPSRKLSLINCFIILGCSPPGALQLLDAPFIALIMHYYMCVYAFLPSKFCIFSTIVFPVLDNKDLLMEQLNEWITLCFLVYDSLAIQLSACPVHSLLTSFFVLSWNLDHMVTFWVWFVCYR